MHEQTHPKPHRQATQHQLKLMRLSLQKQFISPNLTIYYSFGYKQSNSGLFSNQRLLLYHSKEESLRYYSKIPKYIPFADQSSIPEGKEKFFIQQVQNFKCESVAGKISTINIQWEVQKKKHQWIFVMGSSQLKSNWITLLNEVNLKLSQPPQLPGNSKQNMLENPNVIKINGQQTILKPGNYTQSGNRQQNPYSNSLNSNLKPNFVLGNDSVEERTELRKERVGTQPQQFILKGGIYGNPSQPQSGINQQGNRRGGDQGSSGQHLDNVNRNYQHNQPITDKQNNPQQYGDFVEELKHLKQTNKNKFNLTNDLSKGEIKISQEQPFKEQQPQRNSNFNKHYNQKNSKEILMNKESLYDNTIKHPSYNNLMRNDPTEDRDKRLYNHDSNNSGPLPIPNQIDSSRTYQYNDPNKIIHDSRAVHSPYERSFHDGGSRVTGINYQDKRDKPQSRLNRIHTEASKNFKPKSITQQKSDRKWNEEWCDADANSQIYVYQEFIDQSQEMCRKIIDELPFLRKDRQYAPIEQNSPFCVYRQGGIMVVLHFETRNTTKNGQYNEYSPLLYDQQTYVQIKRQFNNYHLITSVTGNRGFIKVPLCCYFQYKGLLALCKAEVPYGFHQVQPQTYHSQFQALQQLIKVRFPYSQFTIHSHPTSKYVIINDLSMLIPSVPNGRSPTDYFVKDFLVNYEEVLQDRQSITDAHHSIIKANVPQFLSKIQTLDPWIIDTKDLARELTMAGISNSYLPQIFQHSNCPHLKKLIASELTAEIFSQILRSEMSNIFVAFPTSQFEQLNVPILNNVILDGFHALVNEFFSYSLRAENIWKVIVNEVNKQYRVVISKEDIIAGYLLSSIIIKNGVLCDFKKSYFDKNAAFFVRQNTIPRKLFIDFVVSTVRYNSADICPSLRQIQTTIYGSPSQQGFEQVVGKLSLRKYGIPRHCNELYEPIIIYLCNFVPFDDDRDFEHLDLYQGIIKEPHTYFSVKASVLAIKWCIKRRKFDAANQIFQEKCEENNFWLGQFNPTISEFYDFFSIYYASVGNYDESIKLSKSSLINCIKILGNNSTPTADKHYQLGNVYFRASKKQQALKQYGKTKQILSSNEQTRIPEYGMILLKMALLYLNFGKMKDCVINALQALKVFDINGGSQQDQIQTFQILARAYEITRKPNDLTSVGALCSQKFNQTENPKVFEKMMKIVLYPKISSLNSHESKSLQNLLFKLQQLDSSVTYLESFSFLHRKALGSVYIMKKLLSFMDNIGSLYQDVIRKDLFRKHRSLSHQTKSEAEEMLTLLEAISIMVGSGFLLGSLKDSYYD